MAEFLKVLSAVLPVFLIALLGFQLRRMDWLTKAADDSLLKVSVNVLLPCLAFSNISNNPELLKPENVWLPPVVGFFHDRPGHGRRLAGEEVCHRLDRC